MKASMIVAMWSVAMAGLAASFRILAKFIAPMKMSTAFEAR